MKGIEAAFFGILGKDVELRTSKSGKPWASISIMISTGDEDADGREKMQWVQTAVFGEAAEKRAGAAKGTRLYVEGTLTLSHWNTADGEVRHGLNCATWRCEKVSNIGKARERKPRQHREAARRSRRRIRRYRLLMRTSDLALTLPPLCQLGVCDERSGAARYDGQGTGMEETGGRGHFAPSFAASR